MNVTSRLAVPEDVAMFVEMYGMLEEEMVALHKMWPLSDGLNEPIALSFSKALEDQGTLVLIGEIEHVAFGFLLARTEGLLDQAEGEVIGSIRLIYVEPSAREVAVGEAMRDMALQVFRSAGMTKFDAHVLPGHRLAKNFFESGGFSARSIIMHHDDERE